ncbi:isoprenylcysteine carboxylmethyltransferase family protein [Chitinophaga sp. MD30]|uniref:methyltransferase family protein n=1 Tax=Chitinophaga sp. MD30 TaxID=2033437 RepID=UPI00350ED856
MAGMGFATGSLISTLVMVIPIFLALQYRIRTEEAALLAAFGDSYRDYCQRTSRLIPGIY